MAELALGLVRALWGQFTSLMTGRALASLVLTRELAKAAFTLLVSRVSTSLRFCERGHSLCSCHWTELRPGNGKEGTRFGLANRIKMSGVYRGSGIPGYND